MKPFHGTAEDGASQGSVRRSLVDTRLDAVPGQHTEDEEQGLLVLVRAGLGGVGDLPGADEVQHRDDTEDGGQVPVGGRI